MTGSRANPMPAEWVVLAAALTAAEPAKRPAKNDAAPPLELLELLGSSEGDLMKSDTPWSADEPAATPEPRPSTRPPEKR